MDLLASPLRTLRGLLRELKFLHEATGRNYRESMAYKYVMDHYRKNQLTSEKLCRAQQELHHQAATYLCLLRSTRGYLALHHQYHAKGERSPEEVSRLVGLQLPQQPGGKGWEK